MCNRYRLCIRPIFRALVSRAGLKRARNVLPGAVIKPPAFDPSEFNDPNGLLYGFAVACQGKLCRDDLPAYAQRAMELQILRNRAELRVRSFWTESGVGLKGALKLFGVGVAFGGEIAAATFGFDPWLHGSPAGAVYALVGVGLIGGGLVPITTGKARQVAMGVSVGWSLAVAALTMQNQELVDPLQARMPGFSQIEGAVPLSLAEGQVGDDEKQAAALRRALEEAKRDYLGARRGPDELRRDFQDGEKKREVAYREAQQKLEAWSGILKSDRETLKQAERAWRNARESHWSHEAAAGIVFILTAVLGAVGPIYLGLWLNERQALHQSRLAEKREHHRLKERTRSLETNASVQRAEARHLLGIMRAYYTSILGRERAAQENGIESVFGDLTSVVEETVVGFRAARKRRGWGFAVRL